MAIALNKDASQSLNAIIIIMANGQKLGPEGNKFRPEVTSTCIWYSATCEGDTEKHATHLTSEIQPVTSQGFKSTVFDMEHLLHAACMNY